MKYFLLSQKRGCVDLPEIKGWQGVIDKRGIKKGTPFEIPARTLLKITGSPYTMFSEVLTSPFFLVSQAIKALLLKYEPNTPMKEIILLDQDNARSNLYFLPILDEIECLAEGSMLSKDRCAIIRAVIDTNLVKDKAVFFLGGVGNPHIVARLDFVESLLRRGARALDLTEVKTV